MKLRGEQMFNLVVIFTIKTGKVAEFLEVMKVVIEKTRKEPGNLQYELCVDESNPQRYFLIEKYQDRLAYEFHTQQLYLQGLRESLAEVLLAPAEVIRGNLIS